MSRVNRSRLEDYLSSDYIEASITLNSKAPTMVYVEGYDDITFWRTVFDEFEEGDKERKFEVTTPVRNDLAKGKKVVLSFAQKAGKNLLLCVDSDFDYLFSGSTEVSREVNQNPYIIQTYIYAIENLLCLPTSLDSLATRITRNDAIIFDFVRFCAEYSEAIYNLFVWYYFAAKNNKPQILTLSEFRNIAKLNYLDMEDNGAETIGYIERQVKRKVANLEQKHPSMIDRVEQTKNDLKTKGVRPDQTHLWVQGHFWQDNVVKVILSSICNKLRQMRIEEITNSTQNSLTKRNDISSYNNALRDIDTVVTDNTLYQKTEYFRPIYERISSILSS